jgi:hypothetical protein
MIVTSLALVQFHMTGPSSHATIRCSILSLFPHFGHAVDGDSCICASRSLVGTMPCITVYHVDFAASGSYLTRRLTHTRVHGVWGCWRTILMGFVVVSVASNVSSVSYSRRL